VRSQDSNLSAGQPRPIFCLRQPRLCLPRGRLR